MSSKYLTDCLGNCYMNITPQDSVQTVAISHWPAPAGEFRCALASFGHRPARAGKLFGPPVGEALTRAARNARRQEKRQCQRAANDDKQT